MSANDVANPEWGSGINEREGERLAALQRFDVLDSPREEAFDRITRLIRNIFNVKIGIVSMIDGHRQWYKSVDGLGTTEAPRRETFCRLTLEDGMPIVVPDATLDPRFADNPNVTGEPHIRFYAGVPLVTHDGHAIGTVCAIDFQPRVFSTHDLEVLRDLAMMAINELELRQRASSDFLTGVLSRRAFKEEGDRALSLASRHSHKLACLTLDLDFFKTINDRFGHAAGDKVLKDVAKACVVGLRQSDLMGRLGGEEFAVLLPYSSQQDAHQIAEKLRVAIESLRFTFAGQQVSVTASFGVSVASAASPDIDSVLEAADEALYEAKAAGRNCVRSHGKPQLQLLPGRRVLKAAQIVFNRGASLIDCTVRSLSENGAQLGVSTTVGLPQEFRLVIPSDRFASRCRTLSQKSQQMDVLFC